MANDTLTKEATEYFADYICLFDRPLATRRGAVNIDHVSMSANIRTYTEQIADDSMVARIRDQVESADNLVFLGFAFHDQNVALLRPEEQMQKSKNIYGTALGMSQSDISVATEQLSAFFDGTRRLTIDAKIRLSHSETCSGLFDFYTKSLPA